jgi:hypothetical protein
MTRVTERTSEVPGCRRRMNRGGFSSSGKSEHTGWVIIVARILSFHYPLLLRGFALCLGHFWEPIPLPDLPFRELCFLDIARMEAR